LDTLHSGIFYAFAAVTVAGGLLAALAAGRPRALGLALVAAGLAALYADLDAGFAALVTLVALGLSALVLLRAGAGRTATALEPGTLVNQLGASLAFRGAYFADYHAGGSFNTAALGRLLVDRDALAVEAVAAALLTGAAAAVLFARVRAR